MYSESSGGAGDDDTTTTSTNPKITHFNEMQHDSRNNRSTYTSAASFGSAVSFGDDNRPWSKMHASVRNDGDRGDADDEAPKDPRISEQDFTQHFTENDFEGHRAHTVYVGVHCLPGSRHHSQRRRKHHHVKVDGGAGEKQSERPVTPPAQRVQFILGEDGDDSGTISHPLFSEYLTLVKEGDEYEWKETARWIKFEEVVEEGGNRWSKPHVATLSLHSLFELRNLLLNGTIILDMEATNLEVIADLVCENMINSGGLPLQSRDKVKGALLRRHRHQHEYTRKHKLPLIRSLADIGRNQSSSKSEYCHIASVHLGSIGLTSWFHSEIAPYYDSCTSAGISLIKVDEQHSTQSAPGITTASSNSSNCDAHLSSGKSEADLNNDGRYLTVPGIRIQKALGSPDEKLKRLADAKHNHHPLPIIAEDMSKSPSSQSMQGNGYSSGTDIGEHRSNMNFMRKIPPGAEASNILVGEVEFLQKPLAAFIRLKDASPMGDLTEVPVPTRFIFILLGPPSSQSNFHEIGRAMATLMSDEIFHEVAYRARKRDHLLAGIDEFLDAVTVLPPGEWDPTIRIEPPAAIPSQDMRKRPPEAPKEKIDEEEEEQRLREESGLSRSGRLFGGLLNDIRRKSPWYLSDFRDALSMQCVASWIFLYFACLSPIITFGGLLSQATGKNMAAMESLVSGFVCGIGYGLFSGQPLTILGSTGPVLVFETIVYEFCEQRGWDYMTFRFWIGTWIAIILMILTAIDASALVCYITRFTEENFATLIAFIFIYKAVENVLKIGQKYPINHPVYDCICAPPIPNNATILDYVKFDNKLCLANNGTMIGLDCDKPDTSNIFLMSVLLFLGTFIISTLLKDFKNALFFPTIVRQYISDFSVIIAIVSMSFLDCMMKVDTPKLEVPHELKPTLPTRNWIITPFNDKNPFWSSFAAIVPAMLGTILIFMDQQITTVIVNRKENKLRKGCGYHLDLFVLSILIQICSIMGLPWFVAATVLSINHVNSLKLESECSAPGEKPQFLGVREQRVTHILIFLTIGLSVFLTPILSHIPMPVLFGVFLYMGVASLKGLQFFDRMLILFMPAKYQPDYMFLRQVPIKRVHLFTLIQLTCLIILWLIKSFSSTSILFPLMLVVMIGIRKSLDLLFTRRELKILDDIMPEMTKRAAADDDLHQLDAAEEPQSDTHKKRNTGPTTIHIPLANGSTNTAAALHPSKNTSQEMPYTSTWQQEINSDRKPIISQLIIPANVTVRHIGGGGKNSIKTDDKPAVIASASIMPEENTDKMDFNNIKNIQVDITHV